MAFVLCQQHGGHMAPLLCAHLRDAMRKRLPVPEVFYVEAWYLGAAAWGHHLCPACAREHGVTENPTVWKDDDALDRLMGKHDVAPVCPVCFEEAKAARHLAPQSPDDLAMMRNGTVRPTVPGFRSA